jgi:hypothetical protein
VEPGTYKDYDYLGRVKESQTFKTRDGRETFESTDENDISETLFKGYIFIND